MKRYTNFWWFGCCTFCVISISSGFYPDTCPCPKYLGLVKAADLIHGALIVLEWSTHRTSLWFFDNGDASTSVNYTGQQSVKRPSLIKPSVMPWIKVQLTTSDHCQLFSIHHGLLIVIKNVIINIKM